MALEHIVRFTRQRLSGTCTPTCFIPSILIVFMVVIVLTITSFFIHPATEMNYTIDNISIKGINLTSPDSLMVISPEFDIKISHENLNKNMGFYYYEKDSSITISYSSTILCSSADVIPNFYQPKNNVTVFETVSRCSGVKITTTTRDSLLRDQRRSKIRLSIDMKIPIRADIEAVETTASSILKVYCDIKVDKLTMDSKIVSKKCVLINKPWVSANYQNHGSEVSENMLDRASY